MNSNQTFELAQDQPELRALSAAEIAEIGGGGGSDFPVIPR
jgi:hypothetical protein